MLFWHLQPGTALKLRCKGFSLKWFSALFMLCRDLPPNQTGYLVHMTIEWSVNNIIQEHQWLCQHWVVDTVFRHSNNFLMGMENVLREALFSPLGIKNVFQDTKKFNVDSPMGTKKMSAFFQNSNNSPMGTTNTFQSTNSYQTILIYSLVKIIFSAFESFVWFY